MSPKQPWRRPLAIVLAAECRKNRAEIEDYNVVDGEQPPSVNYDDPNRTSPQSPIQGSQSSRRSCFAEILVIPLSDGSTREEGNLSSQTPLYTLQQDVQEYYGTSNSNSYGGNLDSLNYENPTNLASTGNQSFGSRNIGTQTDDRNAQGNYREGTKETNNYQSYPRN
ncbi:hypothetical protein FGB62_145g02 [Gracilaria domingensis]|nr:hypothetical protein FGB62_145g02 [Gracilaria domingensis]